MAQAQTHSCEMYGCTHIQSELKKSNLLSEITTLTTDREVLFVFFNKLCETDLIM